MKLSTSSLILAGALLATACKMELNAIGQWNESGHRYRVEAKFTDTSGIRDTAGRLDIFCATFLWVAGVHNMATINPQCNRHGDNLVWADMSVSHGPAGDDYLHKAFYWTTRKMGEDGYNDCEYANNTPGH